MVAVSVMSSSNDAPRSRRRRELDARRSKSRVRLGACLESWGQLKEKLGFSLHSELAQHLLERYTEREIELLLDPLDDSSLDVCFRIPSAVVGSGFEDLHFFPFVVIQFQIIQGKDRNYE